MFRFNYKTLILAPTAILCMIVPFIYQAGFNGTQYFTQEAFILPFIVCGISLLVSIVFSRWGSVLMFVSSFASLLSFVNASYLYLSSVFFTGVPDNLGAILEQVGFHWAFCAIAFAVAMIVSIVAIFLPDMD